MGVRIRQFTIISLLAHEPLCFLPPRCTALMPKILITTSSFQTEAYTEFKQLRELGYEIHANPYRRKLTEQEVQSLLRDDVVAMIAGVEPLTRDVFSKASKLKVVSRCGMGLDSVDLAAAEEYGVLVYNTPDAPVQAVAELTLGMMLSLLRHIARADRGIRAGHWRAHMGGLLTARIVGLVGYGRIGRQVAELLRGFQARILACDKSPPAVSPPGVTFCDLESLLAVSDIVSLHVPYEPTTRHLIDARRLGMMKAGAMLINTSRGGLIDESALYEALRDGHLAGAALDTFDNEPYRGPLIGIEQVVLTAHMGSYAEESRARMEKEAVANLLVGLVAKGLIAHESDCMNTQATKL